MKIRLPFILIFSVFISSFSFPQKWNKIEGDFNRFFEVGKDMALSPLSFVDEDFIALGGTLLLTGAAMALDEESRNISQRNLGSFGDAVFKIDEYFYYQGIGISIAGLYGYGLLADNDQVRNLSVKLAESTIYAGAIMIIMKSLIGRKRAFVNEGPWEFEPFSFTPFKSAFPSGHTTLAFSYAAVMAGQIDNIFWKAGWYAAASLVGIARVYHDKHWISDVVFGAAMGHFIGTFVNNHKTNQTDGSQNISLLFGGNNIGFYYRF